MSNTDILMVKADVAFVNFHETASTEICSRKLTIMIV